MSYEPDDESQEFNPSRDEPDEYEIISDIDPETLHKPHSYKPSNIVLQDDPIAVANNSDHITIEVYERRPNSIFEKPKQLLGLLNDYILHINLQNSEKGSIESYKNRSLVDGSVFEFNEDDFQEIEKILKNFSDDGYDTFIREKDILNNKEAQTQFDERFS